MPVPLHTKHVYQGTQRATNKNGTTWEPHTLNTLHKNPRRRDPPTRHRIPSMGANTRPPPTVVSHLVGKRGKPWDAVQGTTSLRGSTTPCPQRQPPSCSSTPGPLPCSPKRCIPNKPTHAKPQSTRGLSEHHTVPSVVPQGDRGKGA